MNTGNINNSTLILLSQALNSIDHVFSCKGTTDELIEPLRDHIMSAINIELSRIKRESDYTLKKFSK